MFDPIWFTLVFASTVLYKITVFSSGSFRQVYTGSLMRILYTIRRYDPFSFSILASLLLKELTFIFLLTVNWKIVKNKHIIFSRYEVLLRIVYYTSYPFQDKICVFNDLIKSDFSESMILT